MAAGAALPRIRRYLSLQELAAHMGQVGVVRYASIMTSAEGRSKGCAIVEFSTPEEAIQAISTLSDSLLSGRNISVREDRGARLPDGDGGMGGGGRGRGGGGGNGMFPRGGGGGGRGGAGPGGYYAGGRGGGAYNGGGGMGRGGGPGMGRGGGGFNGGGGYGSPGGMMDGSGGGDGSMYGRTFKPRGPPPEPGTSLFVGNLAWSVQWQDLKDAFQDFRPTYADVKHWPDGRSRGWGIVRFETADDAAAAAQTLNGMELMGRRVEVREDKGPASRVAGQEGMGNSVGGGMPQQQQQPGPGQMMMAPGGSPGYYEGGGGGGGAPMMQMQQQPQQPPMMMAQGGPMGY